MLKVKRLQSRIRDLETLNSHRTFYLLLDRKNSELQRYQSFFNEVACNVDEVRCKQTLEEEK